MNNLLIFLLILITSSINYAAAAARDPYKILGIPRNAQTRQVKKAFRQMSKKYHPDRNPGDKKAEEKFMDSAWAYEVLSNATLRRAFDTGGEEKVKMMQGGAPGPGGRPPPFMFPFMFSGKPFPGGGPFSGGGGGHPFGGHQFHGGDPFGHSERLSQIHWFDETPVELHSGTSNNLPDTLVEEMHNEWPDIFFVFRKDTGDVEEAARDFALVADQLDVSFSFYAIDCRGQAAQQRGFCKLIAPTSQSPLEYLMLTSEHFKRSRANPVASNKPMNSERLSTWIMNNAPEPKHTLSTFRSLTNFVDRANHKNIPAILVLPVEEPCPLKTRKLITEQSKRAMFGVVRHTSSNAAFRKKLLDLISIDPKLANEPLMILIADAEVITRETSLIESLDASDLAVDLTLAKFVGLAKHKTGIYSIASMIPRELTSEKMGNNRWCTDDDNSICVIYFWTKQSGQSLLKNLTAAYQHNGGNGMRLVTVNIDENNDFAQAYSLTGVEQAVVAVKGKRKKYVMWKNTSIENFLDGLIDGSLLLREGIRMNRVPVM